MAAEYTLPFTASDIANRLSKVTELEELLSSVGNAKIATGSYVGTGKSGSNDKTIITFDFEPKIVMISNPDGTPAVYLWGSAYLTIPGSTSSSNNTASVSGNTLSFYITGAASDMSPYQFNKASTTYTWVAIA